MSKPVFLAPMAGITDMPFRSLVLSFGATAVVSEMIASEAAIRDNRKTYKKTLGINDKTIIQILGNDPYKMSETAKIVEDLGAKAIDINMGCPAKKIVNNSYGAFLMQHPDLAAKIVDEVVKSVNTPVSVKMRLGWDENSKNADILARKFEELGIYMLTIHGRTRAQGYSGKANWHAIKKVKDSVKIPVLCNGDITSPQEASAALKDSACDGVMIGRGALGAPWMLSQVMSHINGQQYLPSPSLKEQLFIIIEHFEQNLIFYGHDAGIKIFRKHFCWYSKGMKNSSEFRVSINSLENIEKIRETVQDFYNSQYDT